MVLRHFVIIAKFKKEELNMQINKKNGVDKKTNKTNFNLVWEKIDDFLKKNMRS